MTARLTVSPATLAAALLPGMRPGAGHPSDGLPPGLDPVRYPGNPGSRLARRLRARRHTIPLATPEI